MGAVAVTVVGALAVGDRGETCRNSTRHLAVRRANSGIDDVHGHAGTRLRARVTTVKRQTSLVNSIKTPRERYNATT